MPHRSRDCPEQFKDTMFMFANPYIGVTKKQPLSSGFKITVNDMPREGEAV